MSGAHFHRRTFLERLGLGAGAALLSPLVETIVSEAQGALPTRKRLIIVTSGHGMDWAQSFLPAELSGQRPSDKDFISSRDFTLPDMMTALTPLRDRLLLIDGLANKQQNPPSHTGGFSAFSCVGNLPFGYGPGGPTIDQFIARGLGGSNPFRSVELAIQEDATRATVANLFAADMGQPLPSVCQPTLAFRRLFKVGAAAKAEFASRGRLLDFLKDDIKRVQSAFAGRERNKLDQYLDSIGSFAQRQGLLAATADQVAACQKLDLKTDAPGTEDRIDAQFDLAATALICGLTQVVSVASGAGGLPYFNLSFRARLGITDGMHGMGHGQGLGIRGLNMIHNFYAGRIAALAARLSAIKEGDRSIWDNTVVVWTSDNGEAHHGAHLRWPVVIVGNAGGFLKTDGRFLRFPLRGQAGNRSLADLYCTVAHAMGVPTDSFGKAGAEPVIGPLAEIVA